MGLFEETNYDEIKVDLPDRFRIMMFSDGILEVLEQESLAKKEAFLLAEAPALKSDIETVFRGFNVDSSQQYPDDIALLVVDKI